VSLRCIVVRGLPKEAEEDINKFLSTHPAVRVHHMTQSETGDHVSITLIVEESDSEPGEPSDV
jgi:hypothetical protein